MSYEAMIRHEGTKMHITKWKNMKSICAIGLLLYNYSENCQKKYGDCEKISVAKSWLGWWERWRVKLREFLGQSKYSVYDHNGEYMFFIHLSKFSVNPEANCGLWVIMMSM